MLGIRYAIEPMKAAGGGSIINNSSIAAIRYRQGDPLVLSPSRRRLTHYSKLAGVELGRYGIRVNVISPGAIATPIFYGGSARANTLSDEENARKMAKLTYNLSPRHPDDPRRPLGGHRRSGALPGQRRRPLRQLARPRRRRRPHLHVQRVARRRPTSVGPV